MASFNKVILIGNLTRDPQVKYTTGGTAVAEVTLAVNRQWFDKQSNTRKEDTTFVDVTLWGRTAEVAGEYLAKGRPVLIEGRLQLDSWEDRETKQKRSRLRVVGENMTMLGSRGDGGGGGSGGRAPAAVAHDQGGGDQGGFGQEADNHPSYEDTSSGPASGPPSDEVPF
ncbi:MAG: single-stranded DNA-binding protein [Planctomycetota bacterium]